jgi:hypothetical protein
MAITRLKTSGVYGSKYIDVLGGLPAVMAAPTATAGDGNASIAFTAQSGATSYTAISNPGNFTGTGASSPIAVSGLTNGTAYTFQIAATNAQGQGGYSSASNSVTPVFNSSFWSIATANPSGVSSVTFSSIPNTYTHLQLRTFTQISNSSSSVELEMWYNGVQNSYTFRGVYGNGSTALNVWNGANGGATRISDASVGTANSNTSLYAVGIIDIIDYKNTSKNKMNTYISGSLVQSSNTGYHNGFGMGLWSNTAAISSITISNPAGGTFVAGTKFALYGIGA